MELKINMLYRLSARKWSLCNINKCALPSQGIGLPSQGICLSVCPSVCLSLSQVCLSVSLSVCLSVCLSRVCLSVCLSVSLIQEYTSIALLRSDMDKEIKTFFELQSLKSELQ